MMWCQDVVFAIVSPLLVVLYIVATTEVSKPHSLFAGSELGLLLPQLATDEGTRVNPP